MRTAWAKFAVGFILAMPLVAAAQDTAPNVHLTVTSAGPRKVETLTAQTIVRDYGRAWKSLQDAIDSGSPGSLDAYFAGNARTTFANFVGDRAKTGVSLRYLNQNHNADTVFYSPEGDVMQLDDALDCDLQVLDGAKVIHSEHAVLHFVVLMTPEADRWVVRQLQAVPHF